MASSSSYPKPHHTVANSTSNAYPYHPSSSTAMLTPASSDITYSNGQINYSIQTHGLQTPPQSPYTIANNVNNNDNSNYNRNNNATPPPYSSIHGPSGGLKSSRSSENIIPDTQQFQSQPISSSQRSPGSTSKGIISSEIRPLSSRIPMPPIPSSFPQLKGLSAQRLERLLIDDVALDVRRSYFPS